MAVCLVAGGLSLTGCSSGSSAQSNGPFGDGGTPVIQCAPVPRGDVLTFGFDEFSNDSTATAVIENLTLERPRHLEVLAAYAVPISGHTLYGVLTGYPPGKTCRPECCGPSVSVPTERVSHPHSTEKSLT